MPLPPPPDREETMDEVCYDDDSDDGGPPPLVPFVQGHDRVYPAFKHDPPRRLSMQEKRQELQPWQEQRSRPPKQVGGPPPVFFWKLGRENMWLSNWSAYPMSRDGIAYMTVEHYYMHKKALTMGDTERAMMVLRAQRPIDARNIGKLVRGFEESRWNAVSDDVMFAGLVLKLVHHPELKARLLATGKRVIAEASPFDHIWGIGMEESHPDAKCPDKWPGTNRLGRLWMRLRDVVSA